MVDLMLHIQVRFHATRVWRLFSCSVIHGWTLPALPKTWQRLTTSPSAVPGIGRAQFNGHDSWWKDKNDDDPRIYLHQQLLIYGSHSEYAVHLHLFGLRTFAECFGMLSQDAVWVWQRWHNKPCVISIHTTYGMFSFV